MLKKTMTKYGASILPGLALALLLIGFAWWQATGADAHGGDTLCPTDGGFDYAHNDDDSKRSSSAQNWHLSGMHNHCLLSAPTQQSGSTGGSSQTTQQSGSTGGSGQTTQQSGSTGGSGQTTQQSGSTGGSGQTTQPQSGSSSARQPGITLTPPSNLTVAEGGTATYTVELDIQPWADVTVTIVGDNQSAGDTDITVADTDADTPGAQNSLTFTTTNWNTAQTVTLRAAQDDDAHNGSRRILHTAGGGGYESVTASLTATEKDDDQAGLVLSPASNVRVKEGGAATQSARLAAKPMADLTVTAARHSGDADLSVAGGASLTFTPGNWRTPQSVTLVAAEDEDMLDSVATIRYTARSADAGYNGLAPVSVTVTETDNDRAIILSAETLTVTAGSTATYTVSLSHQPVGYATVDLATSGNGSATVAPTRLAFTPANWDSPQTVTLAAVADDDLLDGVTTVTHTGGMPLSGYAGVTATLTATELDNDRGGIVLSTNAVTVTEGSTATYTVSLSHQPIGDATVHLATSGNGSATVAPTRLVFTPANWNSPQTVTLAAVVDDDLLDGVTTVTHTGGMPLSGYAGVTATLTATELDNDRGGIVLSTNAVTVTEGSTATYTVSLSHQPIGDATVHLATSGNGSATVAPTRLVFTPANWNSPQTVTLAAVADDDLLDNITTITHTGVMPLSGYAGATATLTATELDNDRGGIVLSPNAVTVTEGSTATYTVALSQQPRADVTVALLVSGYGSNTVTPTSLTFTPVNWNSPQTVTFTAVTDNDLVDEVTIVMHTAGGDGSGYADATAMLTATEDDTTAAPIPAPTATPTPTPAPVVMPVAIMPTPTPTPTPAPTAMPTPTPAPTAAPAPTSVPTPKPIVSTAVVSEDDDDDEDHERVTPTPTPMPTATPVPTPMPTPAPTPTNTPEPMPAATATPTPMPTATPAPAPTAAPLASAGAAAAAGGTTTAPTPTPTPTPTPRPAASPAAPAPPATIPTATPQPTPTAAPTATPAPVAAAKPTATATAPEPEQGQGLTTNRAAAGAVAEQPGSRPERTWWILGMVIALALLLVLVVWAFRRLWASAR